MSAQSNPQGVPMELLEKKKEELRREKVREGISCRYGDGIADDDGIGCDRRTYRATTS